MEAFFLPLPKLGLQGGFFPPLPAPFSPIPACLRSAGCQPSPLETPLHRARGQEGQGRPFSHAAHPPPKGCAPLHRTPSWHRDHPKHPTFGASLGPSVRPLFLQKPSPISPFLPPHCTPHSHRDPFARPSIPTALPGQGRSHRRVRERRLTAPEIKPLSDWPGFSEMWSRALLAGNLLGFPPPASPAGRSPAAGSARWCCAPAQRPQTRPRHPKNR